MKKFISESLDEYLELTEMTKYQKSQEVAAKKIDIELKEKRKKKKEEEEKESKDDVNEDWNEREEITTEEFEDFRQKETVWNNAIETIEVSYEGEYMDQDSHLESIRLASQLLHKSDKDIEVLLDFPFEEDGEIIQEQDAENIVGEDWHRKIFNTKKIKINEDGGLWDEGDAEWSESREISVSLFKPDGFVIEHSEGIIWAIYK